MTEEERKAIGQCKLLLAGDITLHILDDDGGTAYAGTVNKEYNKDLETVLNLIETQNKMIELMAEFMNKRSWKEHQVKDDTCYCCKFEYGSDECEQCIIEYFRNKAKESE